MKSILCVLLSMSIFLSGCGGNAPNPVDRYMMGDEDKSCNALYAEVSQLDDESILKNREKDNRDTWNIVLFVGGLFIIVPFFFMDVKNSQETEIDAIQARKKALMNIFHDKDCKSPVAESI
mgnify:FL=1